MFNDDFADALLAIELAAASDVTKELRPAWRRQLALLVALWPGDDAPPTAKKAALSGLNLTLLLAAGGAVTALILSRALEALNHGIDAALGMGAKPQLAFKRTLDPELEAQIRLVQQSMAIQVAKGEALLAVATTLEDARTALVVADPVVRAANYARWGTNKASNEGLTQIANADPQSVRIWRAERDACLKCLAYQGQMPDKNGMFPAGLTFGAPGSGVKDPVSMPPLHPNCRCTLWVVNEGVAQPLIEGLVREAQRSVLKGWSLNSESNKSRIEAAQRLLAKPNNLPKSVRAYAQRAITRGEFARGRDVPK